MVSSSLFSSGKLHKKTLSNWIRAGDSCCEPREKCCPCPPHLALSLTHQSSWLFNYVVFMQRLRVWGGERADDQGGLPGPLNVFIEPKELIGAPWTTYDDPGRALKLSVDRLIGPSIHCHQPVSSWAILSGTRTIKPRNRTRLYDGETWVNNHGDVTGPSVHFVLYHIFL